MKRITVKSASLVSMPENIDVLITASHVPSYALPGDAGADLSSTQNLVLEPGQRAMVPTGVSLALPEGYAALVVPRSGLAARHGISIVNTPGIIDAGYRGEIKVMLLNTDREESFTVKAGERIAQLVIIPVIRANFISVETLPSSERGVGGFGSTGMDRKG